MIMYREYQYLYKILNLLNLVNNKFNSCVISNKNILN